jgi:hypothetical protein
VPMHTVSMSDMTGSARGRIRVGSAKRKSIPAVGHGLLGAVRSGFCGPSCGVSSGLACTRELHLFLAVQTGQLPGFGRPARQPQA